MAQDEKLSDTVREGTGNTGLLVFVIIFVVLAILGFVLWKQQPPDTGQPMPPTTTPNPLDPNATPSEVVPGAPEPEPPR